jgi:hypothetical protein
LRSPAKRSSQFCADLSVMRVHRGVGVQAEALQPREASATVAVGRQLEPQWPLQRLGLHRLVLVVSPRRVARFSVRRRDRQEANPSDVLSRAGVPRRVLLDSASHASSRASNSKT